MAVTVGDVIKILLFIGERVAEVSADKVITRIWDKSDAHFSQQESFINKKIIDVKNDYIFSQCDALVEQAFATGQNGYIEYTTFINNVSVTYGIRILTCHPQPGFLFVVVENISRNSRLIVTEDKWKLALDASGDGMWDANLANNTIFFSEKWQEIFGYRSDDITTITDWTALVFPDDVQEAQKTMQRYLVGETPGYSVEVRYKCRDGSYKWILSRGVVISKNDDGTPLRFIGTHTDINERKQAEEELRASKETFYNFFNFSGTGKALLGLGGKWLEVNNVICELTEYTREELYQLHYKEITYPDDIGIDEEQIRQLLKKEINSYTIEKRYVSKSRKVIVTLLTVTLVWDKTGNPKYFICDIVDITGSKHMSAELLRKNVELKTTTDSLMNKIEQMEQMNRIIAHNFRGPVGNIKMLSEETDLFPPDETFKMINDSSKALLGDLNILMELTQIRLNTDIVYNECDIEAIIYGIINQLHGIIYQRHASITMELEVATINYPRVYLESILYNLISNAIKYSRPHMPPAINIATRRQGETIQLIVKDNGLGIDLEKYKDRIFKLNQVFHSGYDSKGVGLFITKTQIEALGGRIEVHSQPGEGAEFIVTF